MKIKNKLIIIVCLLLVISGCNAPLSKQDAERLALREFKDIMDNEFEKSKPVLYSQLSPAEVSEYEMYFRRALDSLSVVYSSKKDDSWSVFISVPDGKGSIEVVVYSRKDIKIPLIEEYIRG